MKMHKNEILYEYLDNKNIINQKENYEMIYSKIQKQNNIKKIINNVAAVIVVAITFGVVTTTIYAKRAWDIEYKEYENRIVNYTNASLKNSKIENLNMEYSYQNGIGVKIDSIIKTPDTLLMNINFDIDNFSAINTDSLSFGYAIFDENNNIYNVSERLKLGAGENWNYTQKLCKELGIKYKPSKFLPQILTNGGTPPSIVKSESGNIIFTVEGNSYKGYPESKKLYIRIFDIGFVMSDGYVKDDGEVIFTDLEDFALSNYEWQFEIDISEEFYKDSFIELKASNELVDFSIEKAILSETGLILELNHPYSIIDIASITLVDEEGNNYWRGASCSNDNKLELLFYINKNDFKENLILKIEDTENNINREIKFVKK